MEILAASNKKAKIKELVGQLNLGVDLDLLDQFELEELFVGKFDDDSDQNNSGVEKKAIENFVQKKLQAWFGSEDYQTASEEPISKAGRSEEFRTRAELYRDELKGAHPIKTEVDPKKRIISASQTKADLYRKLKQQKKE